MRLHLELLILLQRVWGLFGIIVATSLAILVLGAELTLAGGPTPSQSERGAVSVLLVCAVTLATGAAAALAVARGLRKHLPAGRVAALVLAIPNLILVPFGTALGVYAFWVLLNDDARREFGRPPRGPGAVAAR